MRLLIVFLIACAPPRASSVETAPRLPDEYQYEQEHEHEHGHEHGRAGFDSDADAIPDSFDACPLEPENRNGYADDDGCPDHSCGFPRP